MKKRKCAKREKKNKIRKTKAQSIKNTVKSNVNYRLQLYEHDSGPNIKKREKKKMKTMVIVMPLILKTRERASLLTAG